MASQSNLALNTRSMNGIITLSDGAGTTITNGEVKCEVLTVPYVPRTNLNETITGTWNFTSLPTSSLNAVNSNQFLTLGAYTPLDANNVKLTGNQSIMGVKAFLTLPQTALAPTIGYEFTNKTYVDLIDSTSVKTTGNQAISGIKTFFTLPESAIAPTINNQFVNKLYVDSHTSGNYVDRTTNQSIMGIKSFLTLPQAALAPIIGYELTNKTYVDLIDNNNVKLTGNQTIYDQKTFNQGLTIVENGLLKLDAAGNNRISASFDNIITYNALTSHNFGTSSGMTTMSDGVYCKKMAVGLSGKAQTYLNYANIAHLITASTTLTSTYNTFLDSLYFVNLPATLTVVVITLPSVSNDNLGTVLSFYKTTSPLAEFQLLALSGQQIFSSKALYGSTQSMNFLNSTTYIKIVAVKTLSIFGWYVAIGLENAEANFTSIIVQDYVHIKESGLYLGPTPIASVYYKENIFVNVPSLVLNCDNIPPNTGSILFKIQNEQIANIYPLGISISAGKSLTFGDAKIQMSSNVERLEISKGNVGTGNSAIDFKVNAQLIASITQYVLTLHNKTLLISNAAGNTASIVPFTSSLAIVSNLNGASSTIDFQVNNVYIASIRAGGLYMTDSKPLYLTASSYIIGAGPNIVENAVGTGSAIIWQCSGANAGFINSSGIYIYGGYTCKQGTSGGFGNKFNIYWNGSYPEMWIDTTFVGAIYLYSDYRVKENICCEDKSVLDRLCQLKLFEYDVKEISIFKPSGRHYGFFAHEAQELFPELNNIITGKKDELNADGEIHVQTVNILEMTSLYLRAIQELNALVKTLTERCDKQQIQIDTLNKIVGVR